MKDTGKKELEGRIFVMVSFVIYEKKKENRDLYIKIIRKFLYTSPDYYKIYEYDKYNLEVLEEIRHIEGARIYILNVDTPGPSVCDIARKLRSEGDFVSPIILLTESDRKLGLEKLRNVLYLDFISINEKFIFSLMNSLRDAYRMMTRYSVYTFSAFDEIYRIPYDDIYLIKKNLNDDSVTIYTKDDSYLNYITIKAVEESLVKDARFFKIHRSCIINIFNISSYDKKSNTIIFKNGMQTNLVSKYKKAELVKRLKDFDYEEVKCR